ncbi:histidine N-alpha-methyltransferase-like [Argopecten irradians]|uniref:histidine N-alpha-methyltransferase-like n=1 Tax=Argopecten irradians TaxID=31199 RepID=UPI003715E828
MAKDTKQTLVKCLTSNPRHLPTWYNYDDIGSEMEYNISVKNKNSYSLRSQVSVLQRNVQDIIPNVPYDLTLVDIGSGNCSKTRYVINELLKRQDRLIFYPEDISEGFLLRTARKLLEEYESLSVRPISAEHAEGIQQLRNVEGTKLILWFNGIINLSYDDQVQTLHQISTIMTDKCRLVFSADITQDRDAILKAYNDDSGLFERFIKYGLSRLNKEEDSQINMSRFKYGVDFQLNTDPHSMSYIRAYVTAKESLQYPIPGLGIDLVMEKGERLYFHEGDGFSCKYTPTQLMNIIEKAGLQLEDTWGDNNQHAIFLRCIKKT